MAEQRLPAVGSDDGQWGTILNQFLDKEHYNTGSDNPSNGMHKTVTIRPGTASAGTAPLKFTSGTVLTTPEAGAMEFNSDSLYFTTTTGPTRKAVAWADFSNMSGTISVPNGGTGATSLTGIIKGNGTSAFTAVTAPSGDIVGTTDSQTLTNKDLSSSTNTYRAASDTVTGAVELATISETSTGTDTARAVTPDGLSGSVYGEKSFSIAIFESDVDIITGDGKVAFCVPASMNGMNVVTAVATVHTAGTTNTTDIQLRRRRDTTDADVFSTKLTIDSGETSSTTASSSVAVNTSNDDLLTGDLLFVDVDAVSTTKPKGLFVTITTRTP